LRIRNTRNYTSLVATRDDRAWTILLSEARRAAGLTQAQLAQRTGIDRSVISQYETGAREPGVGTFLQMLSAMGAGISLTWFSEEQARRGAALSDLLRLAEELPRGRPRGELKFPAEVWQP
jgi:transcriptional regulator with XRE-family HTH domain